MDVKDGHTTANISISVLFASFFIPPEEDGDRDDERSDPEPGCAGGGQLEPRLVDADEGQADRRHEGRGEHGNEIPEALPGLRKIDGDGPQSEDGKRLVAPSEIAPDYVESVGLGHVEPQQGGSSHEQGNRNREALAYGFLVQTDEVRHDEAGAAEGGVAAGDGGCHHSEQGEHSAEYAEPALGYLGDHRGGGCADVRTDFCGASVEEEVRCYRCPYKGHQALGYHRPVEHRPAEFLILQASGHERALGGVEAGYRAAGDGYEEAGEDALAVEPDGRAAVLQSLPKLGQMGPFDEQAHHQRNCHEQQGEGEQGIYLSNYLVDGKEGGDHIIGEDDRYPDHYGSAGTVSGHAAEDECGAVDEHGAHEQEHQHREYQHHLLGAVAEVTAHEFRQARSAVSEGKHPRKVIMHRARENASEHYPEVGRRPELGTHDSAEDRPRARDIQELDHEHLPRGHWDEIHPVRLADRRCGPVRIRSEDPVYEFSVKRVAQNQGEDAEKE